MGGGALCGRADVKRFHGGAMNPAARYGGDEFAVVLPEAGGEAAARVAQRICARLAADGQTPAVSVSAGAAVFPSDGETVEKLLGAADHALYRMKGSRGGVPTLAHIAACL